MRTIAEPEVLIFKSSQTWRLICIDGHTKGSPKWSKCMEASYWPLLQLVKPVFLRLKQEFLQISYVLCALLLVDLLLLSAGCILHCLPGSSAKCQGTGSELPWCCCECRRDRVQPGLMRILKKITSCFEVQHTRKEMVSLYKKNLSQGGAVSNVRGTVQNIQGTVSNYGGVVGNAYGQVYNATGAVKVCFIVLVSVCVWSLQCRWCRELAVMSMYCG